MTVVGASVSEADVQYPELAGLTKPPKRYLVLTGGLVKNLYIRDAMQNRVQAQYGQSVELLLPEVQTM